MKFQNRALQFSFLLIPFFGIFFISKIVQWAPPAEEAHFCAADAAQQKLLSDRPELANIQQQFERQYQNHFRTNSNIPLRTNGVCVLPVVVHIVHNNGPENISDMQVEQAIEHLNDAFANVGYYDQGTGVNTNIQFCLARQDPDGLPSSGINRVNSGLTNMTLETQDIALKDLSRWNPQSYINVWLVRNITSLSAGPGVAGYAYFPSSHGNPEDGLVVEALYFGSAPASSSVLVHEMGHYLGLYHTFEGGCTNNDCIADGDRICDTPPDQSTAPIPCNSSANTCSTDTNSGFATDQDDMFWNYMDYSDLPCYSAFTQGQADRMQFSIGAFRPSLLDSKGCQEPCPMPVSADFSASATQVLVGTNVIFTNLSSGATDYEWQIDNNPPFSTNVNADFTFTQTGQYWVYLTVNPGDLLCERTDSLRIKVALCGQNAHISDQLGTDAPGCGDPSNMCQTIQYALDNIVCDTDTIFIHSGTYSLPSIMPPLTPIAKIPEGLSISFVGIEDNGPAIIDGNNERRGFQYSYIGSNCIDTNPNDDIAEAIQLGFANLTLQNCFMEAVNCNNTTIVYGAAVQIYNDPASQMSVSFYLCKFFNNTCIDPNGPNNDGRAASGAAIFFNGRISPSLPPETHATISIDSCLFVANTIEQLPNGGHGGAIAILHANQASVTNSAFCNNSVFSENADDGDLQYVRNAGGAVLFRDNTNLSPAHLYAVDGSYFIGNRALTQDGADLPNSSGAAGVFLAHSTGPASITPNTLRITNNHFYDNQNEDGQFHYGNNTGNLEESNNVTEDEFIIDLGADTAFCGGNTLIIGDTIPFAIYNWSTGDSTPTIEVSDPGIYSVTVTVGACEGTGEIELLPCEMCDNGIDDDGDGLVDCNDPDLQDSCCCIVPPVLDLGPDFIFCENTVVVLDASNDFASYRWQDGFSQSPTYTAWQPGTYWVDVIDQCGNMQSDTITVSIDPASAIDLGNDTIICEGESVLLFIDGADSYQWAPPTGLDCTSCPTVTASPMVSTTYTVVAISDNGCTSADTISIFVVPDNTTVADTIQLCEGDTILVFDEPVTTAGTFIDTIITASCTFYETVEVELLPIATGQDAQTICEGDSALIFGNWESTSGNYVETFPADNGCDSIHLVALTVLDTVQTMELQTICDGDTATIFGDPVTAAGEYTMTSFGVNGCDSTHLIQLVVLETADSADTLQICAGDSILIFNTFESESGDFSEVYTGANGCDSTHTITLEVIPPLSVEIQTLPACEGMENGTAEATVMGGKPPYLYFWEGDISTSNITPGLAPGIYGLTITDNFGCQLFTTFEIQTLAEELIDIATQDAVCFGEASGLLTILSNNSLLQYSLDGASFTDQTEFDGLEAGNYTLFILSENDCESSLEFEIGQPNEPFVTLPPDTTICLGDSIRISAQTDLSGPLTLEWFPQTGLSCTDCFSPFARPFNSTLYTLSVTDTLGCNATASIQIDVIPKRRVFIPNVFSPNNDGFNDRFYPFGGQEVVEVRLFRIFDRWGELVYEAERFPPNSAQYGWDGDFRGKPMTSSVFVWYAEVLFLDGVVQIFKGDVILMR